MISKMKDHVPSFHQSVHKLTIVHSLQMFLIKFWTLLSMDEKGINTILMKYAKIDYIKIEEVSNNLPHS